MEKSGAQCAGAGSVRKGGNGCSSFFKHRPPEELDEILALAKFIGDYNMQTGSIDERYLPYVREVAEAIYDEGYRKTAPRKQ